MTTIEQHNKDAGDAEYRVRLYETLMHHIGEHRAIGMAELYERVFDQPWKHRINDTRKIRRLVTKLRHQGVPICSVSARDGGGYYLRQTSQEFQEYLDRRARKALKILALNAKMKEVSLREYMGQLTLNLEGRHE